MKNLVLYASPMSSATPVVHAMAELEVPHECVMLDLAAGEQRASAFLALNPNGRVPTLVVDGVPMFEALAILQWLGEHVGAARGLWPEAGTPERLEALSWSTWAYVTFGGTMQRFIHATAERLPAEGHSPGQATLAAAELQSYLGLLDARLGDGDFLLGEGFSLLDLIVGSVVAYATICGVPTNEHPRVTQWLERLMARDAYRKAWGGR